MTSRYASVPGGKVRSATNVELTMEAFKEGRPATASTFCGHCSKEICDGDVVKHPETDIPMHRGCLPRSWGAEDRALCDSPRACAVADAWQLAKGGPLEGYAPAYLAKELDALERSTRPSPLRKVRR